MDKQLQLPILKTFGKLSILLIFILTGITACKSSEPVSDRPGFETELDPPKPELQYLLSEKKVRLTQVDVDSLLSTLTVREKIGQLFVIPANGRFRNDHDPEFLRLKRLITQYNIGGIIFMAGDIYGQAMMTNKLQNIAQIPLWITQDMEYGAAMRVTGTTRITPAMGIAATGNPQNAYLKGKITAREARALGVHQVFAPVLDVNNNPANPVINVRSFSADPNMVAEYGNAFIRGIESENVLATAKHFPGHGDTDTDSHIALPTINHSYARLDSLELQPFRIAIKNGLNSIMSAHIAFPQISTKPGLPSTLDENILYRILVDSLGFDGLIVTDGLEMSGITSQFSPGEAVVMALKAGADVMLISPDEMTAVHQVEMAIQRGDITEERIDKSVRKILELKKKYGVFEEFQVDIESLSSSINSPEYQAIADRIARESVTIVKNDKNILPIRDVDHLNILAVAVADDQSGSTGTSFARELRKYHANVNFHVFDQRSSEEEKQRILRSAAEADLIIIGSFIMVRSHQPIQLPRSQIEFLKRLTSSGKPSVLVAFGNPYVLRDLPETDVHVLAWASAFNQVQSTVPALFGASDVRGKMPISIPGMYKIGDGIEFTHTALRFDSPESVGMSTDTLMILDEIMQEAINDSVFPGGIMGVMKNGTMVWHKGYGYHDYEKTRGVLETDVYDLASLTKVLSTTTAVMKLIENGDLKITDRVAKYIPEFDNTVKRSITIEHLLLHTSGLPPFRTYVDKFKTRDEILNAVKNEPLIGKPGEQYAYSDLGFIILADIVEKITGQRIDRYIRNQFFYPMGMYSAHFNPSRLGAWMSRRIPPTEIDNVFSRGLLKGMVHDERAYYMDGVAGHAGLFGTARDLANWSQMILNGGTYAGRQYLKPETIRMFTGYESPFNRRGYGFDRKGGDLSTAGSLTSERTFGHLGFTGTSIWMDPEDDVTIILLTNRTFPQRGTSAEINRVRREVADIVIKSIIK